MPERAWAGLPVAVRRTKADIIRDNQRPKAFDLHQQGGSVVGNQGTYIVRLADGRELLLQRPTLGVRAAKKAGRGSAERSTLLYIFTSRPVVRGVRLGALSCWQLLLMATIPRSVLASPNSRPSR